VLSFILDGTVQEQCTPDAVCRRLGLVVIPGGTPHAERFADPGVRCLIVEVTASGATLGELAARAFDHPAYVSGSQIASLGLQLHREFRERDDLADLAIEGLVLQISAAVLRQRRGLRDELEAPGRGEPRWLRRVCDLMGETLGRPLSVGELATEAGVHPVHLARVFRRRYGVSPSEYARRLRVQAAIDALTHSDRSLAEIAAAAGFADQSHMSRQFRRIVGTPPGTFRGGRC
jgi:AraC family transcriptional regulator